MRCEMQEIIAHITAGSRRQRQQKFSGGCHPQQNEPMVDVPNIPLATAAPVALRSQRHKILQSAFRRDQNCRDIWGDRDRERQTTRPPTTAAVAAACASSSCRATLPPAPSSALPLCPLPRLLLVSDRSARFAGAANADVQTDRRCSAMGSLAGRPVRWSRSSSHCPN